MSRLPVYYVSHGGPTFLYNSNDFGANKGAFAAIKSIGAELKNTLKPQVLIMVSGHWESKSKQFEIGVPNTAPVGSAPVCFYGQGEVDETDPEAEQEKVSPDEMDLIYDFYGFQPELYKERLHVNGSYTLAQQVHEALREAGIESRYAKRGIDHGVWVPLKTAFANTKVRNSAVLDVDCPVVQVSLSNTESFADHYKLGTVLGKFRDKGAAIVCSGSSVHNLRDMGYALELGGVTLPYVDEFNNLLNEIVEKYKGNERLVKFEELKTKHPALLKKAHPTLDHFIPLVVAAGAAESSYGKTLYTAGSLSLGWNVYKW